MKISVVAPFYNEEEAITGFLSDVEKTIQTCEKYKWEFIFVDDGSTDGTADIIRAARIPDLRIIQTEHLGLSHALFTGIEQAEGDLIVTIDSDGQFLLEDAIRFADILIQEKADIVSGYRVKRDDNVLRVVSSVFANLVKRFILGDKIRDSTCTLKVFRKEIKNRILYGFDGFHRFIPSFALMNNLKLIEQAVQHRNRYGGNAKFGILNRLPDVLTDVFGVKWLGYKRFTTSSDERRFSFYPDVFFVFLIIYLITGLFGGYFRVVDDFWLYGSLNRFIGYDYSKSYGWDNFIFNEIVPPLIRLLYAVVMNIGTLLGIKYPLEWAGKVIGITVTVFSYLIISRFFGLYLRKNYARWISFLIIFWGITSSEIYSGLARSFSFVLIPLLLVYSHRLSVVGLSVVTLLTALTYPVLLPLFFLTVVLVFTFGGGKKIAYSVIPVISGIFGLIPMLLRIDLTSFSPATGYDSFLQTSRVFNLHMSSDFNLLFGSFSNLGLAEWINFNFLHQWMLNDELRRIAGLSLVVLLLLGILRRFVSERKKMVDTVAFLYVIFFFFIGLYRKEYIDSSYVFKWGILLSSLYVIAGIINSQDIKKHRVIFILAISSLLAFTITYLLSRKFGFGVHEPGRQIQRTFAIIFPMTSSVLFFLMYKNTKGIKNLFVVSVILIIGIIYFPSLKLVSPRDRYVIERIRGLPKGSTVLSHPLTANWIVTHTDKYSTIIDEQIRVTKKNPIRGSEEKIMPTEMASVVLGIYYGRDIQNVYNWCNSVPDGYLLVEDYYFSDEFFNLRREPYISYVEWNNPEKRFALMNLPLWQRHPLTPEAFLVSCKEMASR
ncbi:MAG: glycosyltransferase [Deltaproteobacteria bacterium]|nr:glycosyltransferase [Deltaproteobacteria bacterium]